MRTHLAVIDQAIFALVNKFNRILDGQNMIFAMRIGIVDQGGKGGRFATAGGSRDQNESLGQHGQFVQYRGQAELLNRQDRIGNLPKDRGDAIFLFKVVRAITC